MNIPHDSPQLSPNSVDASNIPPDSPPLSPDSDEASKITPYSPPLSPQIVKRELTTSPLLFDEVIDLTVDDTSDDSDRIPTPTFAPPKKRNRLSLSHRRKKNGLYKLQ